VAALLPRLLRSPDEPSSSDPAPLAAPALRLSGRGVAEPLRGAAATPTCSGVGAGGGETGTALGGETGTALGGETGTALGGETGTALGGLNAACEGAGGGASGRRDKRRQRSPLPRPSPPAQRAPLVEGAAAAPLAVAATAPDTEEPPGTALALPGRWKARGSEASPAAAAEAGRSGCAEGRACGSAAQPPAAAAGRRASGARAGAASPAAEDTGREAAAGEPLWKARGSGQKALATGGVAEAAPAVRRKRSGAAAKERSAAAEGPAAEAPAAVEVVEVVRVVGSEAGGEALAGRRRRRTGAAVEATEGRRAAADTEGTTAPEEPPAKRRGQQARRAHALLGTPARLHAARLRSVSSASRSLCRSVPARPRRSRPQPPPLPFNPTQPSPPPPRALPPLPPPCPIRPPLPLTSLQPGSCALSRPPLAPQRARLRASALLRPRLLLWHSSRWCLRLAATSRPSATASARRSPDWA
jgi:hypothetical protein